MSRDRLTPVLYSLVMLYPVYKTVKRAGLAGKKFQSVVKYVLRALGRSDCFLSIHLIGDERMRSLNRTHRGQDRTTDVLAFAMSEGAVLEINENDLGDIFVSVPQIRCQAKKFNRPYQEELSRMLIHGILHLVGYDHVRKQDAAVMLPLQERLLHRVRARHLL